MRHKVYAELRLGCVVRIKAAVDIQGVVSDHTEYLDGSNRWGVEYWHNGERKTVNCRPDELEYAGDPHVLERSDPLGRLGLSGDEQNSGEKR